MTKMTQPKGAVIFKILVTAIFTVIGGVILGSIIACAVGLICNSGGGGGGGGSAPITLTADQCLSAANACGQSTIGTYTYTCPTTTTGSGTYWTQTAPPTSNGAAGILGQSASDTCYQMQTGTSESPPYYVTDSSGNYVTQPATKTCDATPPDNSSCPAAIIGANGFYASPSTVGQSGKTTLTWDSSNSDGCTISGDNGYSYSGAPSGSVDVTGLTQTTSFTLTCSAGAGGTSASKTIKVIVDPHYKEL